MTQLGLHVVEGGKSSEKLRSREPALPCKPHPNQGAIRQSESQAPLFGATQCGAQRPGKRNTRTPHLPHATPSNSTEGNVPRERPPTMTNRHQGSYQAAGQPSRRQRVHSKHCNSATRKPQLLAGTPERGQPRLPLP